VLSGAAYLFIAKLAQVSDCCRLQSYVAAWQAAIQAAQNVYEQAFVMIDVSAAMPVRSSGSTATHSLRSQCSCVHADFHNIAILAPPLAPVCNRSLEAHT
jgi:hypothetical protein